MSISETNNIVTSEEATVLEDIGRKMLETLTPEFTYRTQAGVEILFLPEVSKFPRGFVEGGDVDGPN